MPDDDRPSLGACCWCEQAGPTVRNIICFGYETPGGASGWCCLVCGLPQKGATAVACDACAGGSGAKPGEPKWLCGSPITERLPVPATEDRIPFKHDNRRHPELARLN